jgi:uncharacterized membrane protein (UPF0127 family)
VETGTAKPGAEGSPPAASAKARDDQTNAELSGRCVLPTPSVAPIPIASGPDPRCPSDPDPPRQAPPAGRVTFADVPGVTVEAEMVRTPRDTARGLMYRRSMPEDRGMLFDLGTREDHKFWMHNTCIPLDMLFVDFDGLIVGIVENAPTLDDDTQSVGCASRFVLEVNAGWARRHGVKAGGFARFAR